MSFDFRLKRALRGLSYVKKIWNPVWLGPLEPTELEEFANEPVDIEDVYSEAIDTWESCQESSIVDKTLAFYTKLYLQDDILVKVDRASMMNSLEVRAPYLDMDLVDFVRRIPYQYKYRNGQTKYILKKCLEPLLDRAILHRKKKGFGIPIGEWLKKGFLSFEKRTILTDAERAFYRKKLLAHKQMREDNRMYLWYELTLSSVL
jgi:asparagine synthase (glutamine-hydrolysing)